MSVNSIDQLNLYGMDRYLNEFIHLYDSKLLPNKILLSGYKGVGKSVLAFHFINYILSKNEEHPYNLEEQEINISNKSFNLLKNNSHPNFYYTNIEDDKKNISVNQIRNMISFCNKSSFNNCERILLIDVIFNLNKSSANSLLKILEEPNQNVYFFLIQDSSKKLLPTIISRCINFKIHLNQIEKEKILKKILDHNFYNNINNDFKNYFFTPGNYVDLYNLYLENNIDFDISIEKLVNIINKKKLYKTNLFVKKNINFFFEIYFFKKFFLNKNNILAYNDFKNFSKIINDIYRYNLDLETLFIMFEKKIIHEE